MSSIVELVTAFLSTWGPPLAQGTLLTVQLALASLPLGLALGLFCALGLNSQRLHRRLLATGTTTLFRALPELLTVIVIYYGVQILLNTVCARLGIEAAQLDKFWSGVIALGLVFGAFAAPTLAAAMQAVHRGQWEAGFALGLSRRDIFVRVSAPQFMRIALPGLGNLWMVLLKETSLLSVLSLADLMRQTQLAISITHQPFLFYCLAALVYLILSLLSARVIHWLESRCAPDGGTAHAG